MDLYGLPRGPHVNVKQHRVHFNALLILISGVCFIMYLWSRSSDYEIKSDGYLDESVINLVTERPQANVSTLGSKIVMDTLLTVTYIGSGLVHLCLIVAVLVFDKVYICTEIVCTAICLASFIASGIVAINYGVNYTMDHRTTNPGLIFAMALLSFFGAFALFWKTIEIFFKNSATGAPYASPASPGSHWTRIDSPPKYEDVVNVSR